MAIIVEDGTIVTNANSYISEAELTAYATARGITITGSTEELLIKAMDYVEYLNFKGIKVQSTQSLQWPRADVIIDYYYWYTDQIPQQLKDGLAEVALSIDGGVDPLSNIERTKTRASVGPISVDYSNAQVTTLVRKINNKLSKLLKATSAGVAFPVLRG